MGDDFIGREALSRRESTFVDQIAEFTDALTVLPRYRGHGQHGAPSRLANRGALGLRRRWGLRRRGDLA